MYIAAFHWLPAQYDDQFHQLNAQIDAVARANPGFVGAESWQSGDGARRCATYYWRDLDSLQAFATDPAHLQAKRQYARWYAGYQIVISEVVRSYGDGRMPHLAADTAG
ncbi:hypothetical protein GCM10011521_11270 [Arenimonas soli]|uniref:Antibiotic biosynthesis monooxygenase n=1 Tax=Arenimonas soli TaxID=2269504 RepID=A0ABQ1HG63_9GAMM|nr:DUF4188 domain-containing protein [Arenimonas soli]GGA74818.1 hypothetical protein GCM10011521_11270 [Arenimonas soli]